jgi:hypothetical protein
MKRGAARSGRVDRRAAAEAAAAAPAGSVVCLARSDWIGGRARARARHAAAADWDP